MNMGRESLVHAEAEYRSWSMQKLSIELGVYACTVGINQNYLFITGSWLH